MDIMDKKNFETFVDSITKCYAKEVANDLPKWTDFPGEIVSDENIDLTKLEEALDSFSNLYLKSVSLRLIAIKHLQECRERELKPDLKKIWRLLFQSIMILPGNAAVSSIGSQGFLSIPLYKYDKEIQNFDFFRLHIWDRILDQYINTQARDNFSIHTHSFYAESWIVCGKIVNDRYLVNHSSEATDYSMFKVEYNQTLNEINRHTSTARNTKHFMKCKQISNEVYYQDGNYSIKAGDYHKSDFAGDDNGLSATLFNFYAPKGLVDDSFVIGPSSIENSEVNRKVHIDPKDLLERIDRQFKLNDR